MIKRRASAAGLAGGDVLPHASPKTTKLYHRTADTIALDEIDQP